MTQQNAAMVGKNMVYAEAEQMSTCELAPGDLRLDYQLNGCESQFYSIRFHKTFLNLKMH